MYFENLHREKYRINFTFDYRYIYALIDILFMRTIMFGNCNQHDKEVYQSLYPRHEHLS